MPNGVRTPNERADDMEGDWLTYEQAAERLNVSPEAVRQKAIRGRWQRTVGNDKRARVRLPDGWPDAVRTPSERPNRPGVRTPSGRASDASLIKVLEEHVARLKEQLAGTEGELVGTREALTEARARAAAAEARAEAAEARAGEESAKTAQAIAAFESLAQRLETIAEARRPWWRKLVG